nr:cache domain-containing protein [Calditrichia bacterium]
MKNWKLGTKIIGLIILGNIMMGVLVFAYFMPMARQRMFDDKRESIRFLVESATGILAEYQQQEKSGALSREAAQQLAKAAIRPLRYGKNGYFWIDNQDYVCQLLPPKPEAENVFRGNLKDVKGNLFIQDLVNGAVRNGSTNVEYWFPKPGEQEASAKFGFTQYFEPWGWIIGTGVYVDDVDAQYAAMRTGILSGFLLVMVVFSALGFYLARKIANPLKALEKASQDIAEG